MKIIEVNKLKIPDVRVIRFARFLDYRGFFTETYKKSDFKNQKKLSFLKDVKFVQCNESFSKTRTIRGMHFQWNPYMGKLVRTLFGRMIDFVLDIRKKSPTFGCIIAYDMPAANDEDFNEWIWIPPGFAHGNIFTKQTRIEYFCSGEYNPKCEEVISLLSTDLDWSLCHPKLKKTFNQLLKTNNYFITDKDRNGLSLNQWDSDSRSKNFVYQK